MISKVRLKQIKKEEVVARMYVNTAQVQTLCKAIRDLLEEREELQEERRERQSPACIDE